MRDSYIINLLPLQRKEPAHSSQSDTDRLHISKYSNLAITDQYQLFVEEEQLKPEQRTLYAESKTSTIPVYRQKSDTSIEPVTTEQQSKYLNLTMTSQSLPLADEQQLKTENGTYFTENAANCKFEETFEENLRYIQSYKLDEALPYMEKLQLYSDPVPNNLSYKELQGTCI